MDTQQKVRINWGRIFTPVYIRHVLSVTRHTKLYGSVEQSNYIPEELFTRDFTYKNGDIFIVKERFDSLHKDDIGEASRYFLVQVDIQEPTNVKVLGVLRETTSFPYPENYFMGLVLSNEELQLGVSVLDH